MHFIFSLAALQSVFPQTELGTFMALTREDKEKQLKELSYIVTGIRLFNRDCGKGGEGIDDLPEILKDALKVTNNNLGTELKKTLRTAFHLTGVILSLLEPLPASPDVPPPLKMKQSLINVRQHEFFLKMLMQDISVCTQHVNDLETEFQMKMQQLQETVQAKTAVPTAQVY
ncbi:PREDICTED: cilia- and flagella-associated protein 206-like, partial [Amphimedon queenslandica]|uniref:Cilia- and flagella-associated protein 206 n=1 Tax=Amphimedon queenslandica TaxID=400682 RepID=A0AAN0K342_AMPQE